MYSDAVPNRQPSRLTGYTHWETHDPDEAVLALSREQRKFRQEIPSGKDYLMSTNTAALETLTFSSIWTPTAQKAWAEADGRNYVLVFWNQGWNEYRLNRFRGRVAAGEGVLATSYMESYWKSSLDRDVIAVSIPSQALLGEAKALAGRPIPDLESTGVLQKNGPIWRLVNGFLWLLENNLFRKPSLLRRERQRRLVTAVVALTPHNIQFREERSHNIPPLHKLRFDLAREYMEAHVTDAVSLGDVAAAAGTSERGLQRAFEHYHASWLAEFWAMRMHAARRDLLAPEESATVNSIAQKYGFHVGRFPAQYLRFHGEYPHATLQLGRRGLKIY